MLCVRCVCCRVCCTRRREQQEGGRNGGTSSIFFAKSSIQACPASEQLARRPISLPSRVVGGSLFARGILHARIGRVPRRAVPVGGRMLLTRQLPRQLHGICALLAGMDQVRTRIVVQCDPMSHRPHFALTTRLRCGGERRFPVLPILAMARCPRTVDMILGGIRFASKTWTQYLRDAMALLHRAATLIRAIRRKRSRRCHQCQRVTALCHG